MKKPPVTPIRDKLIANIGCDLGRRLSAKTIFFHEAIARRVGLNATDTRCLSLIDQAAPARVTAGDLTTATGLTTGAVTGILDRLEAAGFVRRERDLNDRRKVFVQPVPDAMAAFIPLYDQLRQAMTTLASGYSNTELELISGFLEQTMTALDEQIVALAAVDEPEDHIRQMSSSRS